jgi:hypothetical protein
MSLTTRSAVIALALLSTTAHSQESPEVAVAPFAVVEDSTGALRSAADACLDRLAAVLVAKGIRVVRLASLEERDLPRARPARWAVLGRFSWREGRAQAELRLMAVGTGEELRFYHNADPDPQKLAALGGAAAERIAVLVRETRSTSSRP